MRADARHDHADVLDTTSGVHTMSMRAAIKLSLAHALERDPRVFLLGEDIADPMGGSYKVTAGLSTRFGEQRVLNTPISEAAIVGGAVGAAAAGMRPIAELMYVDFTTVAMDQIVNQAAFLSYMSGGQLTVPMVLRTQGSGWRGSAAQHSKSLESWFVHVPGLKYVVPASANDAYWLLRWAVDDLNPVIFFEPNLLYSARSEVDLDTAPMDPTAAVVALPGDDLTVVTWGAMTTHVTTAAQRLRDDHGLNVEVLVLRQLAPLDCSAIVESVRRTGLLAIAHEAWRVGGLGAEIASQVTEQAFFYLDAPVRRIGALHTPHPFAPNLEAAMMPNADTVTRELLAWFGQQG